MSRCLFCCVDDFFGIGVHCQSCDVFGDCAVKQLHALGQITDMVPQGIWFIVVKRCAIQSNFATCRSPHACDCSGQSRFARTRGADNAHRTPGLITKLTARKDACCWPGGMIVTACASILARGLGRGVFAASGGISPRSVAKDSHPLRAR